MGLMVKEIKGNLLNQKGVLLHQVNCLGSMGAGIAKQIGKRFPKVDKEYKKMCANERNKKDLLGKIQYVEVDEDVIFANSFSQYHYSARSKQTVEELLIKNIRKAHEYAESKGLKLHIPYLVGCGLGGGDWNKVYDGIKDLDLVIVNFN